MGFREIPKQYQFSCDACGAETNEPESRRPNHWGEIIISQHAYDFQGHAVADGTVGRLLCPTCLGILVALIDARLKELAGG